MGSGIFFLIRSCDYVFPVAFLPKLIWHFIFRCSVISLSSKKAQRWEVSFGNLNKETVKKKNVWVFQLTGMTVNFFKQIHAAPIILWGTFHTFTGATLLITAAFSFANEVVSCHSQMININLLDTTFTLGLIQREDYYILPLWYCKATGRRSGWVFIFSFLFLKPRKNEMERAAGDLPSW